MAHTEEQARVKWCPMGRWTVDNEGVFHNTRGHSGGKVNGYEACIASDCMMWVVDVRGYRASGKWNPDKGRCGLAR